MLVYLYGNRVLCGDGQKKKKNIPINSKTNYRREMKVVPINMDYCLPQFNALKFVLGVSLHAGSLRNFFST